MRKVVLLRDWRLTHGSLHLLLPPQITVVWRYWWLITKDVVLRTLNRRWLCISIRSFSTSTRLVPILAFLFTEVNATISFTHVTQIDIPTDCSWLWLCAKNVLNDILIFLNLWILSTWKHIGHFWSYSRLGSLQEVLIKQARWLLHEVLANVLCPISSSWLQTLCIVVHFRFRIDISNLNNNSYF